MGVLRTTVGYVARALFEARVLRARQVATSGATLGAVVAVGIAGALAYRRLEARARTDALVYQSRVDNLEARILRLERDG